MVSSVYHNSSGLIGINLCRSIFQELGTFYCRMVFDSADQYEDSANSFVYLNHIRLNDSWAKRISFSLKSIS